MGSGTGGRSSDSPDADGEGLPGSSSSFFMNDFDVVTGRLYARV